MICTKCGELMHQTDKNSFSGRVIREYVCRKCGHSDWEDDGVALWQALEDLQKQSEAKEAVQAQKNTPQPKPPIGASQATTSPSLWQRLTGFFRKSK